DRVWKSVYGPIFLIASGTPQIFNTNPLLSFSKDKKKPLYPKSISHAFHQLVGSLELTVPPGVAAPRAHHLRHSFAVGTLLRWYQSGIDPAQRLIHLSTFLGHVDPTSTAVYLTITADLLQEANKRFERFAAPVLKEIAPGPRPLLVLSCMPSFKIT